MIIKSSSNSHKKQIKLQTSKPFIFNECCYHKNIKLLSYWKNIKSFDELSHIVNNNDFYGVCQTLNDRVLLGEKLTIDNLITDKIISCKEYQLNNNYVTCQNEVEFVIPKLIAANQWNINIVFDMNMNGGHGDIKFYNDNNKCECTLNFDKNGEIFYVKNKTKTLTSNRKLSLNEFNRIFIVGGFNNLAAPKNNYLSIYIDGIKCLSLSVANISESFTKMVIKSSHDMDIKQYYCQQSANGRIINKRGERDIYKSIENDDIFKHFVYDKDEYKWKSFGWISGDIMLLGSASNPNHLINGLPNYNLLSLIDLFGALNNKQSELVNAFMIILMNADTSEYNPKLPLLSLRHLNDFLNGYIISTETADNSENKEKQCKEKLMQIISYLGYDMKMDDISFKGDWTKTIEQLRDNIHMHTNRNICDVRYPVRSVEYGSGVDVVISERKIYNKARKWIGNKNSDKQGALSLCKLKYNHRRCAFLTKKELNKQRNESENALKILFARECCLRIIRSITKSKDLTVLFSEISKNILDSDNYNKINNNSLFGPSNINVFTLILSYIISDVHSTNVFSAIKSIQKLVTHEFNELILYGKYGKWKSIVFIGNQLYKLFEDNVIIAFDYYVINGNKENNKDIIDSLNILNVCFRILFLSVKKAFNNDLGKAALIPIIDPMIVTWLFEIMFVLNNEKNIKLNLIKVLLNIIKLCMPATNWILDKLKKLLQLSKKEDEKKDRNSKEYASCLPCLVDLYLLVRENTIKPIKDIDDEKDDEKIAAAIPEKKEEFEENELLKPFKLATIYGDAQNAQKDGLLMYLYQQQNKDYNSYQSEYQKRITIQELDNKAEEFDAKESEEDDADKIPKDIPSFDYGDNYVLSNHETNIIDSGLIKCSYSSKHFNKSNSWRYGKHHFNFWNKNDEYRFDGVLVDATADKKEKAYFEVELTSHLVQPTHYRFRGGDKIHLPDDIPEDYADKEKDCNEMQLTAWRLMGFDIIKTEWIIIDEQLITSCIGMKTGDICTIPKDVSKRKAAFDTKMRVDGDRNGSGLWCPCGVKIVDHGDDTVRISFPKWGNEKETEEWISMTSERLAPLGTHTVFVNGKTHRLYKLSFPVLNKIKLSFFNKFRIVQTGISSTGFEQKFKIHSIEFYGAMYPLYHVRNIKHVILNNNSHSNSNSNPCDIRKEIKLSKILSDNVMEEWMLDIDRFYYITLYLENRIKICNKRIIEFFEKGIKLFVDKYPNGIGMNEFINLCMQNENNMNKNHKMDKYLINYVNKISIEKTLEVKDRESFREIIKFFDIKLLIKELNIDNINENKLLKYCIARLCTIFEYNQFFLLIQDYIDTYLNNTDGLSGLINGNTISQLLFTKIKLIKWDKILECTRDGDKTGQIKINRFKSDNFKNLNEIDYFGKFTTFGQIHNELKLRKAKNFRLAIHERLSEIKLSGEHAIDAGGPYREVFEYFMSELFVTGSAQLLPLFKLCPNGEHDIGLNRDCFIPENILYSDAAIASSQFEMFESIGKLMGTCMRTKHYLTFKFAPIIWKLICGNKELVLYDINDIDEFSYKLLLNTNKNKQINKILHTFDKQIELIRSGLSVVIPVSYLKLFNWNELEMMICGPKVLNIKLLKKMTTYDEYDANDKWMKWFWMIIENEFNEKEMQYLLMFCWGRKRLPANEKEYDRQFKISVKQHSCNDATETQIDQLLPTASTCYFQLKLPKYSSKDIMKQKLLYASVNCSSIDLG